MIDAFFADVAETDRIEHEKPLLAHYTSLPVLELIFHNEEFWFSNPLFMNDIDEIRFGIEVGLSKIRSSATFWESLGSKERQAKFFGSLDHYLEVYKNDHLLDTYVLCFSEHDREDYDGVLSMWRGYGSFGKGAAVVVDTAKITLINDSPFIIAPVVYASNKERIEWIVNKIEHMSKLIVELNINDDDLYLASYAYLERIKLRALFTKHKGFAEEREWRVVYTKERDSDGKLSNMLHFHNGPRGVQPKLRFKVAPLKEVTADDLSFRTLIDRVILGPSASSELELK